MAFGKFLVVSLTKMIHHLVKFEITFPLQNSTRPISDKILDLLESWPAKSQSRADRHAIADRSLLVTVYATDQL